MKLNILISDNVKQMRKKGAMLPEYISSKANGWERFMKGLIFFFHSMRKKREIHRKRKNSRK